jgi:two-component system LytT family sensor kinase
MNRIENILAILKEHRSLRWTTIFLVWTVVGFFSAAHWYLFYYYNDPYTWWSLLRIKLLLWYLWGLFTPLILWVGRRYRPEGERFTRNLLLLFVSSIIVIPVYLCLYTIAILINLDFVPGVVASPDQVERFTRMIHFVVSTHSTFYYLAFWATIGIDYAYDYFKKYRERELKASRLETKLAQAQLQALRSKLHPHFLFNALNTISSMVYNGKQDDAYETIARLADLLRTSLEHDNAQVVTLEEELEFVDQYLDIVAARFPDRLEINRDIESDTLNAIVPSLILQPLIENAVKYGPENRSNNLKIAISGRRRDNDLVLTIADNGPGLPDDWHLEREQGFGIKSVRSRLFDMYAERQNFKLANGPQGGAVAEIRLPFTRSETEEGTKPRQVVT